MANPPSVPEKFIEYPYNHSDSDGAWLELVYEVHKKKGIRFFYTGPLVDERTDWGFYIFVPDFSRDPLLQEGKAYFIDYDTVASGKDYLNKIRRRV